MKLNELRQKAVGLIEKIGRRGTMVICAVILVGVAVLLNLLLFPAEESGGKLAIDPSEMTSASGLEAETSGEEQAQAVGALFEAACPDAEISVLSGGQPVYYYIVSFE